MFMWFWHYCQFDFCHFFFFFFFFFLTFELSHFLGLNTFKCITVHTLYAQHFLQFYTDECETLEALLTWSVDVHMVLALSSVSFLSLFSTFELDYFWC